jgi:putative transposase
MPWRTSTVETARARFVIDAEIAEDLSLSELCRRHGISRPTGYKWLQRAEEEGLSGLQDRSRRPHSCPHATCEEVVERILEIRKRRRWGARKIHRLIAQDSRFSEAPSIDTVHHILDRHGLVEHPKPRRRRTHPGKPLPLSDEPNGTWTADFKGEFRTRDGNLCFPLTVQDGHSRFLLECRGMLRIDLHATIRRFRRLFREYGLPQRIRTDNGHPFASNAIARLSQLSVWWIELGICPELIEPGKPQQNPRHERMHRDLKRETASNPRASLLAQQRCFDEFRRTYNTERPHEGLAMETPSAIYQPSSRPFPECPEPLEYPAHYEIRRVSQDSSIRWHNRKVFVSHLLGRKSVGLEQVGDGVWSAYFGPVHLGWLDEADYRIMDVRGQKRRRR